MKEEKPIFLGSWKGRVIKAIALDGARTWNELRDLTGLSPKSLNRTLAELMSAKALEKHANKDETIYRVPYNIYKDYNEYFEKKPKQKEKKQVPIKQTVQDEIIQWIGQWKELNDKQIDLGPKHFFLEGMDLDEFSKKIIRQVAKKEIIIINPFVENVDVSKTLIEAVKRGVDTTLVTRKPTKETYNKEEVIKFHNFLENAGVTIIHDQAVHAKIIVADRAVAIISSMNFNSASSAGKSWEAGFVSLKDKVVESVLEGIMKYQSLLT